MSMEHCVVCSNAFDPETNDIAMFEPAMICGNCVQLVRDAYDEESSGSREAKISAGELMKKFDDLVTSFPTKVRGVVNRPSK